MFPDLEVELLRYLDVIDIVSKQDTYSHNFFLETDNPACSKSRTSKFCRRCSATGMTSLLAPSLAVINTP